MLYPLVRFREAVSFPSTSRRVGRFLFQPGGNCNNNLRSARAHELTQIKRHRGSGTGGRQKGSLTHGKKTPANGVNEHEQRTEKRLAAEGSTALSAAKPGGQKPDARRALRGLRI